MALVDHLHVLNGPQTLGRGRGFWSAFAIGVAAFAIAPAVLDGFVMIKLSNFLISGLLALSLCLIWGYCGILSLGQAAFFGLGGYAYGILGLNLIQAHGNTDIAILAGILVPALAAAALGGVMFYARLKGVYVAILTLVVSMLMETFLLQTADPKYTWGAAYLGGFNGLQPAPGTGVDLLPSLTLGLGPWAYAFDGRGLPFYYLVLMVLVAVYLGLRWLVNSSYGYILVGIREDEARTETFGYDVRLIQLSVFCIAAAIAGLSGVLYTAWGAFIHPNSFGVQSNILPVIWVAVAGRKDLTAALLGALVFQGLSLELAEQGEYALLIQGALLVVGMSLMPEGVLMGLVKKKWRRVAAVPAADAPLALQGAGKE